MAIKNSKDLGTKLLNELMVDIIGALIPGFLFIIVVVISAVIPCLIYCNPTDIGRLSQFTNGGFWWVILIVCIIFSYVIGHIFYRADIAVPDKLDVDKQIKKFVRSVIERNYDRMTLQDLLCKEICILKKRIEEMKNEEKNGVPDFIKDESPLFSSCDSAMGKIKDNKEYISREDSDFLTILFPEEIDMKLKEKVTYSKLSQSSIDVIDEYENYFDLSNGNIAPQLQYLLIFYCILHCQMDIGCAISKRCEFPYTNYYKYLLKRDMRDLLQHVNWYTVEKRSKNKINSLKIQIQIFANEAYALINKNESHIRMSSSTWHITRLLIYLTGISTLVFAAITVVEIFNKQDYYDATQYIALLLPMAMFFLIIYIRKNITKYIHYQRMREIQYTLQIYHQFKEIIEYRKSSYTSNRG